MKLELVVGVFAPNLKQSRQILKKLIEMSAPKNSSLWRYWPPTWRTGRVPKRLLLVFAAIAFAGLFLEYGPYSAYGHCRRGRAWTDQKDYAKAITEFSEAIRINPQLADAYDGRGLAWSLTNDYAKAIADFDQAVRLDPRSEHAYYERGNAWIQFNEFDKAIHDYTEAIRLNAESRYAYDARAGVWLRKRDFDKSIADYTAFLDRMSPTLQLLDEEPDRKNDDMNVFRALAAAAYAGRGSAWQLKHDNDKALADFNESIRIDPQNAGARVCRGSVWQDKGDYEKALADYDEALRLDASIVAAYVYRAWLLAACPDAKFRDGRKAIVAAKKACELADGNDAMSLSLEALAAAYAEAGDFEQAVKRQRTSSTMHARKPIASVAAILSAVVFFVVAAVQARSAEPRSFDGRLLEATRSLGQPIREISKQEADNEGGYWVGVQIVPGNQLRRGVGARNGPLPGAAEGY